MKTPTHEMNLTPRESLALNAARGALTADRKRELYSGAFSGILPTRDQYNEMVATGATYGTLLTRPLGQNW